MQHNIVKRVWVDDEADLPGFAHEALQWKPTQVKRTPPPRRLVDGKINIASGEDANAFDEHHE